MWGLGIAQYVEWATEEFLAYNLHVIFMSEADVEMQKLRTSTARGISGRPVQAGRDTPWIPGAIIPLEDAELRDPLPLAIIFCFRMLEVEIDERSLL